MAQALKTKAHNERFPLQETKEFVSIFLLLQIRMGYRLNEKKKKKNGSNSKTGHIWINADLVLLVHSSVAEHTVNLQWKL